MNVIILAAGAGIRMRGLDFPKPLLPVDGVPLILHVMRACPPSSKFFVAINSEADVLRDFLLSQGEFDVTFIDVGMPDALGAGPGLSLRRCLEVVKAPALFMVSDGLIQLDDFPTDTNWLGVAENINEGEYCFVRSNEFSKLETSEKKSLTHRADPLSWWIWTGVGHIKDWQEVITNLESSTVGEKQCSPAWSTGGWTLNPLLAWHDLGTRERYEELTRGAHDYRKSHALALKTGNRFVKVFPSEENAQNFMLRQPAVKIFSPVNITLRGRVVSYDMIDGVSAYENMTPELFKRMLHEFEQHLWVDAQIATIDMSEFYKSKTLSRAAFFLRNETLPEIFQRINWSMFKDGISTYIHGDLQFDNILIDNNENVRLIDWRSSCGDIKNSAKGDLYYDLAKLLSGILLNISVAKKGPSTSWLNPIAQHEEYIEVLEQFHNTNGYDWYRTQILCATCFISMAGVHTEPYASAFFDIGVKQLTQVLSQQ